MFLLLEDITRKKPEPMSCLLQYTCIPALTRRQLSLDVSWRSFFCETFILFHIIMIKKVVISCEQWTQWWVYFTWNSNHYLGFFFHPFSFERRKIIFHKHHDRWDWLSLCLSQFMLSFKKRKWTERKRCYLRRKPIRKNLFIACYSNNIVRKIILVLTLVKNNTSKSLDSNTNYKISVTNIRTLLLNVIYYCFDNIEFFCYL